jgi:hypothetical protein
MLSLVVAEHTHLKSVDHAVLVLTVGGGGHSTEAQVAVVAHAFGVVLQVLVWASSVLLRLTLAFRNFENCVVNFTFLSEF